MKRMKTRTGRFLSYLLAMVALLSMTVATGGTPSATATSNAAVQSETYAALVQGTIVSINNQYGNVYTSIQTAALFEDGYKLGDILFVTVGDVAFEAPLVNTFSDVDRGSNLIISLDDVLSLAINYGNFAERNKITVGMPVTISMAKKAGYLSQSQIRHLEKSEKRSDYASDEIFANFRAVTLGKIAPGRLYRSCHPANGEARAPYAALLVEKADIKTVINLADNDEELAKNAATAPYYQKRYTLGQIIALGMGLDFTGPDFTAKLHRGLGFMIAHPGPYLIHCNEGKDRAGMISALLEGLMGARVNEIIADYMTSYANYFQVTQEDPKYDIISQIILNVLKDINYGEPVTDANLQAATERYLVKTVGLTPIEVNALKARLR